MWCMVFPWFTLNSHMLLIAVGGEGTACMCIFALTFICLMTWCSKRRYIECSRCDVGCIKHPAVMSETGEILSSVKD